MKVGVEEGTAALDRERVRVEKLLTDSQITVYCCCPMFIMHTYFHSYISFALMDYFRLESHLQYTVSKII